MADDIIDLSEVRRRAWETRRAKYGPAGHRGVHLTYKRNHGHADVTHEDIETARDEISSVRRAIQVHGLPDAWAHRAIDRLDAADHLLGGPPPIRVDPPLDRPALGPEYFG